MEAKADLWAYEEYLIVDAEMPTNDMAWVVLSVPDRLAELEKRLIFKKKIIFSNTPLTCGGGKCIIVSRNVKEGRAVCDDGGERPFGRPCGAL